MNQKFVIVDDFYDIAHIYHKSIIDSNVLITDETTQKLSYILSRPIQVMEAFNEVRNDNSDNSVTANTIANWVVVIYLTMPPDAIGKRGLSFYTHKRTGLDAFPNEYACQINGWQNMDDIMSSFNPNNRDEWEEYGNVFVKYNRCVIFHADHWHSYGHGFGNELNNSMIYQKLLLKNV